MKEKAKTINQEIQKALETVKSEKPLTVGLTNNVTINDCTNAMLAIGGTAAMFDDDEDGADFAAIAQSFVINIGKLNSMSIKIIKESCKRTDENNTPVIIDPVGISVTENRKKIIKYLIKNHKITCIKGNMSEIRAIGDLMEITKDSTTGAVGVDANDNDLISEKNLKENAAIVKKIAKNLNIIIVASGPIDLISNGEQTYSINNGDEMMSLITGSGCMLSMIVGVYESVNNPFIGAIAATAHMGIAGEKASEYVKENNLGTGTFRTMLIDYLYKTSPEDLKKEAKIKEIC